jgi:hypothetical protein
MKTSVALLSLLVLPNFVLSQDPPPPAPELSRYDVMLGNWEGRGVVRESASSEPQKWTAVSTVGKIVDGYGIQGDVKVDLGPEAAVPLMFHTIYAWDDHSKQHVRFGVSNLGSPHVGPVHWTADGKLISSGTMLEQGSVVTDHSVSEFSKDSYKFRIERSVAGGAFFVHVEGTFRRGGNGFSLSDPAAQKGWGEPAKEMQAIRGFAGKWRLKGKVSPMPGMPAFPISGTDEIQEVFGGHVQVGTSRGDPIPDAPKTYAGAFCLAWDSSNNCYQSFGIDNMGGLAFDRGYRHGERKLLYTGSYVIYGAPQTTRMVSEWDASGDKMKLYQDRCALDAPPERSFEGDYERVKG